jgi:alginate O-acetyltransferase complex protein AlgJ
VRSTNEKSVEWTLVMLFCCSICAPSVCSMLGFTSSSNVHENRRLNPFPTISPSTESWASFPVRFEAYFNDHFGLRNVLIPINAYFKVKILGVTPSVIAPGEPSPLPARTAQKKMGLRESASQKTVLLGKEGWLFFAGEGVIDDYRRTSPLSVAQIDRWKRVMEERATWLDRSQIKYLVAIAPNKHTVYSEYLPDTINQVRATSRFDQILQIDLRGHSNIEILDMRKTLARAKKSYRVYHQTDTHWNDLGAFMAYQEILKSLFRWFPLLEPLDISWFEIVSKRTAGGGLAHQLGMTDYYHEEQLLLKPIQPRLSKPLRRLPDDRDENGFPTTKNLGPSVYEVPHSRLPRAVVVRDSFGTNLIPFLAEHFSRMVCLWQYEFPVDVIEKEKPDVVIQEIVERKLMTLDPTNPDRVRFLPRKNLTHRTDP